VADTFKLFQTNDSTKKLIDNFVSEKKTT